MSSSLDLQRGCSELLRNPRQWVNLDGTTVAIREMPCPVLIRRDKELKSDIEAAQKNFGLCVMVFPPLPTAALQREQSFIFFDNAEVMVRIYETPATNKTGIDAYEAMDRVMFLLHFTNPGGVCANPLRVAQRPAAMVESPTQRILNVFFACPYQLNPTANS
jgi:hypothetical protein